MCLMNLLYKSSSALDSVETERELLQNGKRASWYLEYHNQNKESKYQTYEIKRYAPFVEKEDRYLRERKKIKFTNIR